MKSRYHGSVVLVCIMTACVSIPKETVTLSQTLGSDLNILHNSHRNLLELYYGKIKDDINSFVDEVYAPFVIHFVLKAELDKRSRGEPSLYEAIEIAGQKEGKEEADEALNVMLEFQEAARSQIESKRQELLSPIAKQEFEILSKIDQSYENAIYANSTITGYLKSIRKVKETQQEALSMVGLGGADTLITNTLVKVSEKVNEAVETGKKIDIQSDEAFKKLEDISNKIKELTTKN